ncbi:preprotein translocase subunit SecA, partial [Flavobacteriaceae bacterium]|nr:preprotein translocase subunit SecA [Flavobacteriaceae bacterium]
MSFFSKLFPSKNRKELNRVRKVVEEVNYLEESISSLSNDELRNKTIDFKDKIKSSISSDRSHILKEILPEAFAVVREAAKRTLSLRHFDVQIIGGILIHEGKVAEMKTGEGKTLMSTLPSYLNSLTGEGVHIVTVNDYLAERDSEEVGRVFNFLGVSVGCVLSGSDHDDKKNAYSCDITYVTNNELGFDYLRDNMKLFKNDLCQRGLNFAIIDEVDSILIDEARTPLIISGSVESDVDMYKRVSSLVPELSDSDYQLEEKDKNIFLTDDGVDNVEKKMVKIGLIDKGSTLYDSDNLKILHCLNQSLKAYKFFKKDTDYIVRDSAIIIIDEFSGRAQEGRRFSNGLHQALEAKELLPIAGESKIFASITFQNFFRLYKKLSGMTGTAITEANEFNKIYNLQVMEVPTNIAVCRVDEDDEIYKTQESKYKKVIEIIKDCNKRKQPILVGTSSIEKSEIISKLLKKEKLKHNVLNANHHEKEASIIAQAGSISAITIATNMAGRGTDIVLGGCIGSSINELRRVVKDESRLDEKISKLKSEFKKNKEQVIKSGGLYVLGTERNESRRIDNQLRGRSGRQGDVGYSKFLISLEDDLMRIFGS